jgi:hypothetical protein
MLVIAGMKRAVVDTTVLVSGFLTQPHQRVTKKFAGITLRA